MRKLLPGLLCLTLVTASMGLLSAGSLFAQSQATTGVVRGLVADQFSKPIPEATIVLRETGTNFERTVTSNERGIFTANLLPLGTYEITASAPGFSEFQQTGIRVRVGATVEVLITLVNELEEVVVEAGRVAVDVAQSEAATRLPDDAVEGLPNNGRNFLNLTLLTPGVAIVQGPDGDELSIAGQKGIHNNISVDGADFNNPFFGEQRGGQRPAFTFNLDAVEEIVVVPQGANAEFGRSSGGFVNVITKSGTNTFKGSTHYFGKYDFLSANSKHGDLVREPDFMQHQVGFTLGGPIVKDKLFFFTALDAQLFDDTKQKNIDRIAPRLREFMDTAYGGALAGDYGPIDRTNDALAYLLKLDLRLSSRHYATLKYNFTWSEQVNGTFDVDPWGRSSNAVEKDWSNAINGSLMSILKENVTNEFRFQWARENRPRPYDGPGFPGIAPPAGIDTPTRPFPDTGVDFVGGYRFGMPFFIPVKYYDTRFQLLDNVSILKGNHLIKFGAEWNRVESVQTFIGFANGRFIFGSIDGFLNYVEHGNQYVECSNGTTSTTGACPAGADIVGPVVLYLQQAGVGGLSVEQAGTQSIPQHELAVFVQDSWDVTPKLTLNYGLRWEAQVQPDPITPPDEVFYSDFIGKTSTTPQGKFEFPSDGTIPSDWDMFQPRFGFAYDVKGDKRTVVRGSAGVYYARIPGLNLASSRSTNGSRGQTIFRNSALTPILGAPPNYDELLPSPAGEPFRPDVFVFDKDFKNPRTISASFGVEHQINDWGLVGSIQYMHARTDDLTRFVNRNDPVAFGDGVEGPWSSGLNGGFNGVGSLTTVESSAKSRYNGVTFGLRQSIREDVQFQINYTLSWDKSDDDNERDPFTLRYVDPRKFDREYNWSDRDQRHRLNAFLLTRLPGDFLLNSRMSYYSAQPVSESCGTDNRGSGQRSLNPFGFGSDRICPNGTILLRNTLRKDNEFFSVDLRLTRVFKLPRRGEIEAILEVFNLFNTDNFRDPTFAGLLFNFDGTVQSGLGDPRQVQVGLKYRF